jgi:protein-S-isoprenylcysteine O-methyltransferase Ste14
VTFPKPYADAVAKLRVFGGFLMAAAFLWFSQPSSNSLITGLPIAIAGLALRGWAAGHLEKNLSLTVSGPYAHVRNPLYIGTLTAAAGFAVASRRWELGVLFAAVFLLVYLPVVELEEQHLARLFPDFKEYAALVPRLLPRTAIRRGGAEPKHFRWSSYRRNREYEALAGFVAGTAVLLWKVLRS